MDVPLLTEPKFGIGKKKKRKMRSIIHNLLAGKSIDSVYSSKESIQGWLNYLKGVDLPSYKNMTAYWKKLKARYSP
jgi:hypothetical protein